MGSFDNEDGEEELVEGAEGIVEAKGRRNSSAPFGWHIYLKTLHIGLPAAATEQSSNLTRSYRRIFATQRNRSHCKGEYNRQLTAGRP